MAEKKQVLKWPPNLRAIFMTKLSKRDKIETYQLWQECCFQSLFLEKCLNKIFKDKIIDGGYITLGVTFLLGKIANNLILIGIVAVLSHKYEFHRGVYNPVLLNLLHIKVLLLLGVYVAL